MDSNVSKPSPLQVVTGNFSSYRTQVAAVAQFRETGICEQSSAAPTLQAILDHCFARGRDFVIEWKGRTGSWVVRQQRGHPVETPIWEPEGTVSSGAEPKLYTAQFGSFRAYLSHNIEGWRMNVSGISQIFDLGNEGVEAAKAQSLIVLREVFGQSLALVERAQTKYPTES